MGWGDHIKSFSTLFQPMLNYCRKYEDVKFNIFEDMTMSSRCILFRTPGIFSRTHSPNNCAPTATEINISPVPYIVSDSRYFVPVTRNSCRSFVYDILLKFENLPVMKSRNRAGQWPITGSYLMHWHNKTVPCQRFSSRLRPQ